MLAASLSKRGLTVSKIEPQDGEAPALAESFEAEHDSTALGKKMESSSPPVPFPLLADVDSYEPGTMPLRSKADPLGSLTDAEKTWIEIFRKSIPSFKERAAADATVENAVEKAAKFAERFTSMLEDFVSDPQSHGGPPTIPLLCRLRDIVLREVGFHDIFKSVKDDENSKALHCLPSVLKAIDDTTDTEERVFRLIKGVLAGNVFDLGAPSTIEKFDKGEITFETSFEQLLPRPWVIDDAKAFQDAWKERVWKKVVIFCDNSGVDVVLGVIPLARELCRAGSQVVLAANDMPAINDITYYELLTVLQKIQMTVEDDTISAAVDSGNLLIVNSGSDLPVMDLAAVSPELAFTAEGAELVIFVGMGRAIETNLNARFTCDALNIGMIKHKEVAEFLNGRLYDAVVKFTPANAPPTPSRKVKELASLAR